jgi:N-acetylneuraminic acid mutarotase
MTRLDGILGRILLAAVVLLIPACGGSSPPDVVPSPFAALSFPVAGAVGGWGWYAGSTINDQSGIYGTQGMPAATNSPGARMAPAFGRDRYGGFWLFGGRSYDESGLFGEMNDTWHWNGSAWTWVTGSKTRNPLGVFGTKGVASASNIPGGRDLPAYATDPQGRLWVFGGIGYGATLNGELSDLWMLDEGVWTWIAGPSEPGEALVLGTKGVAAAANTPGGREQALAWIDAAGNFWLFGGYGSGGHRSDLWKFDGTTWTWVAGPAAAEQSGVYGTQGVAAAANAPGGRSVPRGYRDASGNLWLFGGYGRDSAGTLGVLNDLWKFDGTNWTWVKGSSVGAQPGVYGTKGVPAAANTPGARFIHTSAQDSAGNFWVMGGDAATTGYMNDVWKFDGTNWTWVSGSSSGSQTGLYGTKGTPSPANQPGSRGHAAAWFDKDDQLWIFGGEGLDSAGAVLQLLNDLWRYTP